MHTLERALLSLSLVLEKLKFCRGRTLWSGFMVSRVVSPLKPPFSQKLLSFNHPSVHNNEFCVLFYFIFWKWIWHPFHSVGQLTYDKSICDICVFKSYIAYAYVVILITYTYIINPMSMILSTLMVF